VVRASFLPTALMTLETWRVSIPTILEATSGQPAARERIDARLDAWSRRALAHCRVEVDVDGLEHVPKDETVVVMSNHLSNVDILVIYQAFPDSLRMVAKQEMRLIPLLGPAMGAAEFVFIDRRNPERARAAIAKAADRIKSGINVWIAPEGTRSTDGQLGVFKKGGFILALHTGSRILPATIRGTREVMPKGSLRVKKGHRAHVRFHPPIDPAEYGYDRRDELVARVREVIASGL